MQEKDDRYSPTIVTTVDLGFSELEGVLARLNGIEDAKRTAFRGRLKHFLKLGALPEVMQGRGRPSSYGAFEILKMTMLCEVARFGVNPEDALRIVDADPFELCCATLYALSTSKLDFQEFYDESRHGDVILYFQFNAFSELGSDERSTTLKWRLGKEFGALVETATRYRATRGVSAVNLSTLLRELQSALRPEHQERFATALRLWTKSRIADFPEREFVPPWRES